MTSDLLTAFIVFLCVGCGSSIFDSGPHARWPDYAMGYANRTKGTLSDVGAHWKWKGQDYEWGGGEFGLGTIKQYHGAPDPIPASALVTWKTPDGKQHSQTVEVAEKIPNISWWAGTIWFKITDNGVEVIPLSDQEMHKLAQAQKEYP